MSEDITVYILAGGKSSRFGSDKALALVGGKRLIQHVTDAAAALPATVTLVVDREEKYAGLGFRCISDELPGQGPMGGLLTALKDAEPSTDILLLSCDLIGLETSWLRQIWNADKDAASVMYDTQPLQPLLARYSTSLLGQVQARIAEGNRHVCQFVASIEPLLITPPPHWDQLVNVNYIHDIGGG